MPSRTKDPFQETSMTFGQHLQELRVCLFRAVIGLAITVVFGLIIGGNVVRWINAPLSRALEEYVQKQADEQAARQIEQMRQAGMALPIDTQRIQELISRDRLIPQETFIDPHEMIEQLKRFYPAQGKIWEQAAGDIKPAEGRDGLVRFFAFHSLEDDKSTHTRSLGAAEPFTIYVKASMLVGIVLASPWIFYQLWLFVAAGLYPHERWYVHVFLPFSIGLFLAGAALAFGFVFQPVLRFLFAAPQIARTFMLITLYVFLGCIIHYQNLFFHCYIR